MGRAITERFSDGEFNFQIDENVRGGDVFIVQPTSPPTDEQSDGIADHARCVSSFVC